MSNPGTERVLRAARVAGPPGWTPQAHDAASAACGCAPVGRVSGVPAVPVAAERRPGRAGTPGEGRACLLCGARWQLGADGYSPAPGAVRSGT